MKNNLFQSLPEIEELDKVDLSIGDKFLYGESLIDQKYDKEVGDTITYYEVVDKSENNIRYIMKMEKLEKQENKLWQN